MSPEEEVGPPPGYLECAACHEMKSVEAFYTHTNGKTNRPQLSRRCKDCDNGRQRQPTPTRMVRNRARNRAMAELVTLCPEMFEQLYDKHLARALREHEALTYLAAQRGDADATVVRLRPGPPRAGQSVTERLDVARCPRCHEYHDHGHQCPSCGKEDTPPASPSA